MSDYQIIERKLSELMEEVAVLKAALGVDEISISSDVVRIHGTDDNGDYVVSNPTYGTAEGLLFRAARFYPTREDE